MRKALLISVALVFAAGAAFAQAGSIGIFADPAATDCNLVETYGLGLFYVCHVMPTGGVTGSAWAAPMPACMAGAVWISDAAPFMVIGNSQTGISMGYGSCITHTFHLITMQFFLLGTTTPCCEYRVVHHPSNPTGRIEAADCEFEPVYATGGTAIVNANESCQCDVPTRPTTWGGVKALYSE